MCTCIYTSMFIHMCKFVQICREVCFLRLLTHRIDVTCTRVLAQYAFEKCTFEQSDKFFAVEITAQFRILLIYSGTKKI